MDVATLKPTEIEALLRGLAARAEAAEREAEQAKATAAEAQAKARELEELLSAEKKVTEQLVRQIALLTKRLAKATSRPEQLALQLELNRVQKRLDALNRESFGSSSERRKKGRDKPKTAKDKAPQTGHGPTPQPNLARQQTLHRLPDDARCTQCGGAIEPWGDHTCDSEEIDVVERTFVVRVHQRQTYKCVDCGHLETAAGPARPLTGGRYSTDFAVAVATDKYRDGLPLARQAKRMAEQGLVVTRQTLWDQCVGLYILLVPNLLELQRRILAQEVIHADETPWRLIRKGGSKRWWAWVLTDGTRAFIELSPSRGQAPARELFGDYDGIVVADRYVVYHALEKARTKNGGTALMLPFDGVMRAVPTPDYTLSACWMHARRGFIRAARMGSEAAEPILDHIGALYAVEAQAAEQVARIDDDEARQEALVEARRALRADRSAAILRDLEADLAALTVLEGTALADAVAWIRNGWTQLVRFLDDPRIPLDNGVAERILRGVVLGRNVFHGCRSVSGMRVAALFYSLLETCRLQGVDGQAYLREAARRALADRDAIFLPEDFARM